MPVQLPPAQDADRPYAVALVCLGNICRSPMAHVVLAARLADAGLAGDVTVTSAGTGDWHVGGRMDERAAATLSGEGYDPTRHRARQVDAAWLAGHDLLLAMDATNRDDLLAIAPNAETRGRVMMFRAFDPQGGPDAEVPDPYAGDRDGFAQVLVTVQRTADTLVELLANQLPVR